MTATGFAGDRPRGDRPFAGPTERIGRRGGRQLELIIASAGVLLIGIYLFFINAVIVRTSYDTWIAFVLAPGLFMSGALIVNNLLKSTEPDHLIRRIVIAGLGAKILGGFARFGANEFVLGHADAEAYFHAGAALSREFRSFVFNGPATQFFLPDIMGTKFVRLLTGLIYVITGPTHLGGYIVYSFLSFWGLYLFYRAYSIAIPDGLRRRYAVLLFFLPSMVFWPSSIGKEAWMTTMLGLGSYGVARLLAHRNLGYVSIFVAMAAMGIVRPHVAVIFSAALTAALVLRRTRGGAGGTGKKILGLLVLAVAVGILLSYLRVFFGLEGINAEEVLNETERRSSTGGSEFDAARPTSITGLPWAVVTVLFRPFLFEASSPAALFTALEGTVLLALLVWNLPRLARIPKLIVARPYVGYVIVYTLIFAGSFSAINNFGILARQRTQAFPIAIVPVTIPYQSLFRTRDAKESESEPSPGAATAGRHPPDDPAAARVDEAVPASYRPVPYRPPPERDQGRARRRSDRRRARYR